MDSSGAGLDSLTPGARGVLAAAARVLRALPVDDRAAFVAALRGRIADLADGQVPFDPVGVALDALGGDLVGDGVADLAAAVLQPGGGVTPRALRERVVPGGFAVALIPAPPDLRVRVAAVRRWFFEGVALRLDRHARALPSQRVRGWLEEHGWEVLCTHACYRQGAAFTHVVARSAAR